MTVCKCQKPTTPLFCRAIGRSKNSEGGWVAKWVLTANIFVYNCVVLEKGKKTHETFHILKMKTHFKKEPHFENENMFLEK